MCTGHSPIPTCTPLKKRHDTSPSFPQNLLGRHSHHDLAGHFSHLSVQPWSPHPPHPRRKMGRHPQWHLKCLTLSDEVQRWEKRFKKKEGKVKQDDSGNDFPYAFIPNHDILFLASYLKVCNVFAPAGGWGGGGSYRKIINHDISLG